MQLQAKTTSKNKMFSRSGIISLVFCAEAALGAGMIVDMEIVGRKAQTLLEKEDLAGFNVQMHTKFNHSCSRETPYGTFFTAKNSYDNDVKFVYCHDGKNTGYITHPTPPSNTPLLDMYIAGLFIFSR